MRHQDGQYEAYDYIDHPEIQPYWTMAQQYVLADEMFPTEFGGSFTAHLTLVAGTDDIKLPGQAEVDFPNAAPDDCDSPPRHEELVHHLEAESARCSRYTGPVSVLRSVQHDGARCSTTPACRGNIYATKCSKAGIWEPFEAIKYVRYGPDWTSEHHRAADEGARRDRGERAARVGKLGDAEQADSDHPHGSKRQGPSWVASVVNAIGESSYWPTSAIIVVLGRLGRFYDNGAAAARLSRPRHPRALPDHLALRQAGLRVRTCSTSTAASCGSSRKPTDIPAGSIGSDVERLHRRARRQPRRRLRLHEQTAALRPF